MTLMRNDRKMLFGLAFAIPLLAAATASAAIGDWADGTKARVRLVAAGIAPDGTVDGAIEIALPPGWKTYWRDPGTAGIAPVFDFSGSVNFANPAIAFPVPERVDDGYSVTNVYEGGVVLPFRAAVAEPGKPAEIVASLQLGVCEEVCVPDAVTAHLAVGPATNDPVTDAILSEARAKLPGPPQPGVFAVDSIVREGGTDKRPVFRIAATVPTGATPEVFVEGPTDWAAYAPVAVETADGKATFDVKFSLLGAETPISGAGIRVTLVAGTRAIEQTITLD
jgi:DsbC/DsbD-like thiol-disulfide interchange protein